MEHTGMARMFQTLVEIGLEGYLTAFGSIYEAAVLAELVNHLKETSDAKKGEGDKSVDMKEDKDRVDKGKVQEVLGVKDQIIEGEKEVATVRGEDGFEKG
ncbi:hypothetical protein F511_25956 [Dorcoceras hygrometricum]|uniref:Uncharacterized protein n=1 Tax=Dorcoceras hygrometricum TaxID=472368 RepID=A0A2Z7CQE3_9LAMI|nr:hypothetical protein F511_25956 [Dorcoceras hygrometricum]